MKYKTLLAAALCGISAISFGQSIISPSGYGNVTPYTYQGASATYVSGKGIQLSMPTPDALMKIDLPAGTNWSSYSHLQMTVQNVGAKHESVFIAIASTGIWCYTEMGLAPGAQRRVIIPFETSAQTGTAGVPQPINNSFYQVYSGSRVDKPNVKWVWVQSPNQSAPTTILINEMKPIFAPITLNSIVDQYGQQAQVYWKGKILTDPEINQILARRPISGVPPYSPDIYGGVNGTSQFSTVTGKWHTEKQNGKWYIIDPLGNRFFSSGVLGVGHSPGATVTGKENRFAPGALPSLTGPFASHYETSSFGTGIPTLVYNFYTSNLQRRLGANWKAAHLATTIARMKTWGFTTAGPSSWPELHKATNRVPFIEVVGVHGTFAKIWDGANIFPMADVYDPTWAPAVQASLAQTVLDMQGNPYNVGLFVDNEQPWAKPHSYENGKFGLTQAILQTPPTQPAKIALVNMLRQRYSNNISALNSAWLTSFPNFEAILLGQYQLPANIPPGTKQDLEAFTLQFARLYFSTIKQKLNVLDYQGMYLGCRFRDYTMQVVQAAKESCDVLSFNNYEHKPSDYHEDVKFLDFPMMISEVGFAACDLGRVSALPNLLTESDRAVFFRRYLDDAATWPNLVGIHWYKWEDDVVSGRFFDGYNMSMGLVSIVDIPYWDTVDVLTAANTGFHARLLNN